MPKLLQAPENALIMLDNPMSFPYWIKTGFVVMAYKLPCETNEDSWSSTRRKKKSWSTLSPCDWGGLVGFKDY